MSIITIILVIAVVGLLLWVVTTYVPMPPAIRSVLIGVVALALVLWVLQLFGLLGAADLRVR